jgi:hypothetical protein
MDLIKWNHHENIHRIIAEYSKKHDSDDFFDLNVTITEKIDGSNLSIHIKKYDNDTWKIESIIGRNSIIWPNNVKNKETNIYELSYGNAGKLEKLPDEMFNFSKKLAENINTNEIIIYGEAYRYKKQKFSSWHPFGYKLPSDDYKTYRLTTEAYTLFKSICNIPPENYIEHDIMMNYLETIDKNVVFPPPIYHTGSLGDGIDKLKNRMLSNEETFEGLFIISNNSNDSNEHNFGYKWKTGEYDEQKQIPNIETLNFKKEKSIILYNTLMQIYNNKANKDKKKNKDKNILKNEIEIATRRELSKMESITNVPKKERVIIINNMIPLIVDEIVLLYKESEIELPWTIEEIKESSSKFIPQIIMNL